MSREFSGNPARYRKLAWLCGLGTHAYLYLGMFLVEYVWHDRSWILRWPALAVTLVSALLFTRLSYVSFMTSDARWGSGSRWRLVRAQVKLPEEL
jgi:hypothetical protein